MEGTTIQDSLKNVMTALTKVGTAQQGYTIMVYDTNNNPAAKIQAPTGDTTVAIVFEENASATASTQPTTTASADTMGKLYLVGSTSGTKYQWITTESSGTYSWLNIGSTNIDLSQYATLTVTDALAASLDEKEDKVEGKSLIDSDYADNISYSENDDYIYILTDVNNKIIWAIKTDGSIFWGAGVPQQIKDEIATEIDALAEKTDIVSLNDAIYTEKAIKNLKRPARAANTVQYTPFVLLHASDIHGDGENFARIVDYLEHYHDYIDDAIISGDMAKGVYDDDIAYYRNTEGGQKIMLAIGNHDTAKTVDDSTDWTYYVGQASYERYIKDFYAQWGNVAIIENKCYYYKDYADYGIRMIVTDCMEGASTDQQAWLESTLASTPEGYSVMCICHYPYYPKATDLVNGSPHIECSFDSRQDAPTTATSNIPASFISAVSTWLTANNNANAGRFICWLSGHTHADYVCIAKNTTQLVLTIDTASHRTRDIGYSDTERVADTKTMDLFNLIAIDTYQKLIKVMRVGANLDSWMRKKDTMCIQYASNNVYSLTNNTPELVYCS